MKVMNVTDQQSLLDHEYEDNHQYHQIQIYHSAICFIRIWILDVILMSEHTHPQIAIQE